MKLSSEVRAIILRFAAARPVPQGDPGEAHEEGARQWSTELAEQIAFERPRDGFGKKRADPGRPISKDAIARQDGATLLAWDVLTATGTGRPTLVADPDSIDITGQVFVPVTPRNHLGIQVGNTAEPRTGTGGPAAPGAATVDLVPVIAAIERLAQTVKDSHTATERRLADLADRIAALEQRPVAEMPAIPPVVFPDYTASLPGGGALVLKPRT